VFPVDWIVGGAGSIPIAGWFGVDLGKASRQPFGVTSSAIVAPRSWAMERPVASRRFFGPEIQSWRVH
jgi:hypothetical protein